MGIGGLPRGCIVEIYGPESSGKTTLTLSVIAQMQKLGGTAAFINAEDVLDPQYAQKRGLNASELLISQPDTGEQTLKFYASVHLDIRLTSEIKKDNEITGSKTRGKVVKNKVSPPFKQAKLDILYGEGISCEVEIIELCLNFKPPEKADTWYSYKGENIPIMSC